MTIKYNSIKYLPLSALLALQLNASSQASTEELEHLPPETDLFHSPGDEVLFITNEQEYPGQQDSVTLGDSENELMPDLVPSPHVYDNFLSSVIHEMFLSDTKEEFENSVTIRTTPSEFDFHRFTNTKILTISEKPSISALSISVARGDIKALQQVLSLGANLSDPRFMIWSNNHNQLFSPAHIALVQESLEGYDSFKPPELRHAMALLLMKSGINFNQQVTYSSEFESTAFTLAFTQSTVPHDALAEAVLLGANPFDSGPTEELPMNYVGDFENNVNTIILLAFDKFLENPLDYKSSNFNHRVVERFFNIKLEKAENLKQTLSLVQAQLDELDKLDLGEQAL